ncbi:MAG: hypothetical protein RIQ49_1857 [Pseudomonadota bacterium]
MKRIVLFIATNLAVVLVLSVAASLLGVNRFLTANGLQFGTLLAFAALMGFGGAFISLWMSKPIAKWSTGARVIERPQNELEHWLVNTVARFAHQANIPMPEVAIYDGEPNAFATGPSKSNALVAVSTGLLQMMDRREAEAVIAHEVAHVANGDMVTLTLIQGVVNTFVIFICRSVLAQRRSRTTRPWHCLHDHFHRLRDFVWHSGKHGRCLLLKTTRIQSRR